jgi:hypothetical protein
MLRTFVKHPHSVGESYGEHFVMAGTFGLRMMFAGLACLVHAVFPFLFEHTGSRCVGELHGRMAARRSRSSALPDVSALQRAP